RPRPAREARAPSLRADHTDRLTTLLIPSPRARPLRRALRLRPHHTALPSERAAPGRGDQRARARRRCHRPAHLHRRRGRADLRGVALPIFAWARWTGGAIRAKYAP